MARDTDNESGADPTGTPATSATPSFQEAVQLVKKNLQAMDIHDVGQMTRHLYAHKFANEASRSETSLIQLIDAAERDPFMFEVAGMLAASLLENGDDMPDALREWSIKVLKGKSAPPAPRHLRKGIENETFWRDFYVWSAVLDLVDLNMKATRNAASPPVSACDAVAEAMRELGLRPTSYSGVVAIWSRLNKAG